MKTMRVMVAVEAVLLLLVLGACAEAAVTPTPVSKVTAPPGAAKSAWEAYWEQTLAAARQEGQVNLYWGSIGTWREPVTEVMKTKYGIAVDILVGRPDDLQVRLMNEARAGVRYADVVKSNDLAFRETLQGASILDNLEKELVLPEVLDPKIWWRGQLDWLDPDTRTWFGHQEFTSPPIAINTDLVKPGEIGSWNDLLDTKWKGKMVFGDPTITGSRRILMQMLAYRIMDWDFVVRLSKQEPVILRDVRLMAEWVARGRYPICVGPGGSEVFSFIQGGAPLAFHIPAEGTYVTPGAGYVGVLKNRPHPNAARVFVNYFLGRERQTLWSKSVGYQTSRIDVPTDILAPFPVRQPGMKYPATTDKEFLDKEPELRDRVIQLFRPLTR